MKQFSDLLFELSSDERMGTLLRLRDEKTMLSHLAAKQNITVTETSRHLQRLNDAMLIQKNVDGLFELTKLGELVIQRARKQVL